MVVRIDSYETLYNVR